MALNHKNKIIYSSICCLYLLVCIFYYNFTNNDHVVGFLSDDAVYLFEAEFYSPWEKIKSNVTKFIHDESRFPPLYPLSLGLLGVNSDTPAYASNITIIFFLCSLLVIGYWLFQASNNLTLAALIPCGLSVLPGTLLFSQGLWSEFLFILLLYCVLSILASDQLSTKHWLAAALFLGLTTLTRATGLAGSLAFTLLLLYKQPRYWLIFFIISFFPFLYWQWYSPFTSTTVSYYDELLSVFHHSDISALFLYFDEQFKIIIKAWIWLFIGFDDDIESNLLAVSIVLLIIIFAFIGYIQRIKSFKFDALLVTTYVPVLLIWPYVGVYFMSRFLFPVLPILLFFTWVGINTYITQNMKLSAAIWLLLITITILPYSNFIISRGLSNIDKDLKPYTRDRIWLTIKEEDEAIQYVKTKQKLLASLKKIPKYIKAYECLYSTQAPLVMLHSKRISIVFPAIEQTNSEFETRTNLCKYFVSMPTQNLDNSFPVYYPLKRVLGDKNYLVTPIWGDDKKRGKPSIYLIERV